MRERSRGQKKQLMLAGGALFVSLATGALWAVLDSPDMARGDAIDAEDELPPRGDETTTTSPTTTSTRPTQTPRVPGSLPDPTVRPATTIGETAATRSRAGGGGSGTPRTAPANQPPVIVDPGISSDGLTISVRPTFADPETDDIAMLITVDGAEVSDSAAGFSGSFDERVVGYTHEAEVGIQVTDASGNTTTETFNHTLEAITTVVVSDVKLRVTTAGSCFEGAPAQRFGGTLTLAGPISTRRPFSEELRADRTEVVLAELITGEVVGRPGGVDVSLIGGLDGLLESHEASHDEDDSVLTRMFQNTDCRSFLSYRVEVTTR